MLVTASVLSASVEVSESIDVFGHNINKPIKNTIQAAAAYCVSRKIKPNNFRFTL
jgi:hypothetical protein